MSSRAFDDDSGTRRPARNSLPERASLEQLRKRAKDLLRAARAGDADALARIAAERRTPSTGDAGLHDAQRAIALEYGFASWPKLVHHVEGVPRGVFRLRPLIRPPELEPGRRYRLDDGTDASADDVFAMFVGARDGDARLVRRLLERTPGLATVEYNYTPPIHFSVREGHRDITDLLLHRGADPTYRSYPFRESLLTFAEDRGHDEVADLLRKRLAERFAFAPGTEKIMAAAAAGDLEQLERELARDPSLARASNETGDTPLHRAAQQGHLRLVRALIDAGADVDSERGDGYRPIHCALMPNWFYPAPLGPRQEIVELLLSRGARHTVFVAALLGDDAFVQDAVGRNRVLANFEDTCHHRVLSAAVRRGHVAMTRLLLEHGADPTLAEEGAPRGLSLWIAVNDRNTEIVRMLMDHGADPRGPVESSGTPASRAERDPVMTELLRAYSTYTGTTESDRDRAGRLLLEGRHDEAATLLQSNPELLHGDEADWGDGVLAGPARDGRHDVLSLLIQLGAKVPRVSKWGASYYFKHATTAAFLLERGMDPNHMNWHRFSLLHHMAAEGRRTKAELLLAHGADIDAIDEEYRSSPLGVAARSGQEDMVRMLLDRGADPVAAGAGWAVPATWAEKKGHDDIQAILKAVTHPREDA